MTRPSEIARFVEAQAERRVRSRARRNHRRTQARALDLVHVPADRRPRHVAHVAGLRDSRSRRGGGVPASSAAVATPARYRQRRGRSPAKGRGVEHVDGIVDRRREAGLVDDAVRRGGAHAASECANGDDRRPGRTRRKRFSPPPRRRVIRAANIRSSAYSIDVRNLEDVLVGAALDDAQHGAAEALGGGEQGRERANAERKQSARRS